jgi:hypothetical protein
MLPDPGLNRPGPNTGHLEALDGVSRVLWLEVSSLRSPTFLECLGEYF